MLKHFIVAAVSLSSLAFAAPPHRARPVAVPPPPPPPAAAPAYGYGNGDRADVARGQTLVRELNDAIARRDYRRVQLLDNQMQAFLQSELAESQGLFASRDERGTIRRIRGLQSGLASVSGRFDFAALNYRRSVYGDAVQVALNDLRPGRGYGRR